MATGTPDNVCYYIIYKDEDGDYFFHCFTAKELKDKLARQKGENTNHFGIHQFIREMPEDMYELPSCQLLIIRGQLIVPQPEQIIMTWDLGNADD